MWLSTKPLISTWLKYDDNMQVSLDENAVREWMREFGKKYDTVGTTRTITTPNGKTAEVSGGTYGWSVDEDSETKTLIASIKNGESPPRKHHHMCRKPHLTAHRTGEIPMLK